MNTYDGLTEEEKETMGIRSAGLLLRLKLWKPPTTTVGPRLSGSEDEKLLAILHETGVVERRDDGLALTAHGVDWMQYMERTAYVGLGIFLGIPRRSFAEPVGETSGQVTFTLLVEDLFFLLALLRKTLPPVTDREYDRHRAMQEVICAHFNDAVDAVCNGPEEYDKTDTIKIAQMFGLVPFDRGGSA